ncbi:MAG: hypothetical protein HY738_11150 [Bacteroidia bacterium]|nr:hypothetical protein [Bacteroidia bacterium]
MIQDYLQWNGRYISNFFVLLNPITWNLFWLYKLIPLFFIILIIVVSLILIHELLHKVFTFIEITIIGLIFSLLYISQVPDIAECIYWFTGSVTYLLPCILSFIYFTSLSRYLLKKYYLHPVFHFLFNIFLIIFIIGFNEVNMLLMIILHIFFVFTARKIKLRYMFLSLFLITCLASIVMFVAPGNSIRASYFPEKYDIIHSLLFSLLQTIRFSSSWIIFGPFILATILFIPLAIRIIENQSSFIHSINIHPYITTFLPFLIIFIFVFPPYFCTGILGQHRTLNSALYFFLISWFFNIINWISYLKRNHLIHKFNIESRLKKVLFILFLCGVMFTGNGYTAMTDIIYNKPIIFDKDLNNRYIQIESFKNKNIDICKLPCLTIKPQSLFVLDITEDENHWSNIIYANYFFLGKKRIKLEPCNE